MICNCSQWEIWDSFNNWQIDSKLHMDDRVTNAICKKIDEALVESEGVLTISRAFKLVGIESEADFILGIIIGRIYNSFHYQTRRILGRNATVDEFNEFVQIITARSDEIKGIIKNQ